MDTRVPAAAESARAATAVVPRGIAMMFHIRSTAAVTTALLVALSGCSQDAGSDNAAIPRAGATSPPSTIAATGPVLVALGDSSTTGAGDSEGAGWAQRYADLLEAETGKTIEVFNRSAENQSSDSLAGEVESDQQLRDDIARADYVVIGTGGADLNPGDDAWAAGRCSGPPCYTDILASYKANIERIATAVAALRAGQPTVFRAVTAPNVLTGAESVIPPFLVAKATEVAVFQASSNRESTCTSMRAHGGECIDLLTVFNGPDGTQNGYTSGLLNLADCCYASSKGQQRMAEILLATGFKPTALK